MNYVELTCEISPLQQELAEIITAELAELGYESFVESGNGFSAYIVESDFDLTKVEGIELIIPEDTKISFNHKVHLKQNWNEVWERNYFEPIVVADQCVVRSTFHENAPSAPYEIYIDPKMSFGTGHHQTTSMMMEEILEADVIEKDILDMGTGTGILAILCSMRDAKSILGVDIDEWAYSNSLENIKKNNIDNIEVKIGGPEAIRGKTFDVVLANINRNVLLNIIENFAEVLRVGGKLIMSGFYSSDLNIVREEAEQHGFKYESYRTKENWIAASFTKTK